MAKGTKNSSGAGGRKEPSLGKKKTAASSKRPPLKAPARANPKSGTAGKKKAARKKGASRSLGRVLVNWGGTLIIWSSLVLFAILAYFAYGLPDLSAIEKIEKNPSITLVSESGESFATYGDLYGKSVPVAQMSPHMKHALLAIEDRHFYNHFGINPVSLARALWANYQAGRVVQGGSTLTQQLAKNLFLTPERTISRKIREVLLAFWLEAKFTKDEILTLYLNRMYFGSGTYGVEAAAHKYFARSSKNLDLGEAAMIAGLLKAPSRYAPTNSLERAQERANIVVQAMVSAGYIDQPLADKHKKNPATLRHAGSNFRNIRYFADWTANEVRSFVGQSEEDLIVSTTLNLKLQKLAETNLEASLKKYGKARNVSEAALITMSPNGAVKAMVGGRNYSHSAFNRATSARRQPGSAFKTFVYLAGFEQGMSPDDNWTDSPVNIGGWQPKNYTKKYLGQVTLRESFARSINTVAVKLSETVGRQNVVEMAARLGISSTMKLHPSIALGTVEVSLLELSSAYAIIANDGIGIFPHAVKEIRTKSGKVLYRRTGSGQGRLISGSSVNKIRDVMAASISWGSGKAANPGREAAGKTGTSQDFRDAWFVGFTPDLVTGVWFGNDNGDPMKKVTGGSVPALTWKNFMTAALKDQDKQVFATVSTPMHDAKESLGSLWDRIVAAFGGDSRPTGKSGQQPKSGAEPGKAGGKRDFEYLNNRQDP